MSFFPSSSSRFRPRRDINMRDGSSPESDMFFTDPTQAFAGLTRAHLADRLNSSVFEDFPTRRPMRSFPSHGDSPAFGSLHRHRQHQHPGGSGSWGSENLGSQESSPTEGRESMRGHPFFQQRSESIPVRVAHESRHGSRSSTPESTGSGHSHASGSNHSSRPHSNGPDSTSDGGAYEDSIPEGAEEHPGVASKTGRQSFTARRQPKVHHIPIHVEPRDGSHPVVLTPPPETTNPRAPPDLAESPTAPPRKSNKKAAAATPIAMPGPHREASDSYNVGNGSGNANNNASNSNGNTKKVFAMPMPMPPNMAANAGNNTNNNSVPVGSNGNNGNAKKTFAVPAPQDCPDSRGGANNGTNAVAGESKERVVPIRVSAAEDESLKDQKSEADVPVTAPAPSKKKTAVELVEEVRLDVEHQRECVARFEGVRGDKQYLYLDEMLTRDLIKLDNISTEGDAELRKARRAVIVAINECIQALEQKVSTGGEEDNGNNQEEEEEEAAEIEENRGQEQTDQRAVEEEEKMDIGEKEESTDAASAAVDQSEFLAVVDVEEKLEAKPASAETQSEEVHMTETDQPVAEETTAAPTAAAEAQAGTEEAAVAMTVETSV